VYGTFQGSLNNDPSSNFTSDGFASSEGDAISGLNINVPTAPGGPLDQTIGFTLTSAEVPEPASLALLGFGMAGLGVFRRRRAKH
jgi:hypothetical protein